MNATTVMAVRLSVVGGLLVSCATAPTSRADQEALLAEATASLQQMRAEDPALGELVRRGMATPSSPR